MGHKPNNNPVGLYSRSGKVATKTKQKLLGTVGQRTFVPIFESDADGGDPWATVLIEISDYNYTVYCRVKADPNLFAFGDKLPKNL